VVNAVVDALSPLGVRHIEMPCTPSRVWRAMQGDSGVGAQGSGEAGPSPESSGAVQS
jgi:carbon-monoxide dehydrogenase large subunit